MMLSIFFIVTVVNYFKRMKAVYAQIYWIMVFLDVVDLFVFFLLWAPQTSLSTLKWDIVGTPVLILQSAIEIHVLILLSCPEFDHRVFLKHSYVFAIWGSNLCYSTYLSSVFFTSYKIAYGQSIGTNINRNNNF